VHRVSLAPQMRRFWSHLQSLARAPFLHRETQALMHMRQTKQAPNKRQSTTRLVTWMQPTTKHTTAAYREPGWPICGQPIRLVVFSSRADLDQLQGFVCFLVLFRWELFCFADTILIHHSPFLLNYSAFATFVCCPVLFLQGMCFKKERKKESMDNMGFASLSRNNSASI
jgi:hypothetical protein